MKALFVNKAFFYICFSLKGFYNLGFYYYYFRSCFFRGVISFENVEYFKFKFNYIIKVNGFKNIFFSLKLINSEIFNFFCTYNFSDFFYSFVFNLDAYLYTIFWKLVKRRHPRRPNTWIYSKYWKYIKGVWTFFLFDPVLKFPLYLYSNFFFYFKHLCLPSSFFSFFIYNELKLGYIWFLKYFFVLTGIVKILWKKQFGKCFFCSFFFEINFLQFSKILFLEYSFFKKKIRKIVLVHKYCDKRYLYLKLY